MRNDYILCIVGKAQQGKTTLLYGTDPLPGGIVPWAAREGRVFVLDVERACPHGLIFRTANQLRLYLLKEDDGVVQGPPDNVYCFRPQQSASIEAWFRLLSPPKPGLAGTIVLDEAHRYVGSQSVQSDLEEIIRVGGNYNQNVVVATRRFKSDLSPMIRTQTNAIISFQQTDPASIRELQAWGADVEQLGRHEFLCIGSTDQLPYIEELKRVDTARFPSQQTD
jgi:hypothetical protein